VLPGVHERFVRGLGDPIRPVVLTGIEGALGFRNQLLGPVHIHPLGGEDSRFPAGHGEAVERAVLIQLGPVFEVTQQFRAPRAQSSDEVDEEAHDNDGEDHDEDERDDLRAGQTRHRSPFVAAGPGTGPSYRNRARSGI